jgi:hypothetical protein
MSIEKSLYQAPQGIESLAQDEEPIEIEIVDPESVGIKMGGMEITLDEGEESSEDFNANLAEEMPPGSVSSLASDLDFDITQDIGSRKDWEKAYSEGLKLLGLHIEDRTEPWDGACGVFHPLITEAIVRFQAEMVTETFPTAGPVLSKIIGKETPEVREKAINVQDDMNFELTEEMKEFRPEHERMLFSLPAVGSTFKKTYYDPGLGRPVSMFVPAEDIILPYGTTDMDTAYRVTHVMRKTKNDIVKLQRAGFYLDIDLPDPQNDKSEIQKGKDKETGFNDLSDERYTLYECHVDLDLEGFEDEDDDGPTGIMLPYVVTFIKGTNDVLSIRRNWKEGDDLKLKRQHFVHYQYIPGFGAYGFGLFHLIGGYAKSATSIMRQLVDAGTLSNLPGGLKSRGLRIKGDDTPIRPGEFRDVDLASGNIRDSILPLPYKEPSAVLAGLLGTIVEEGRRFAATADMQISDMSAQAPVGTTLALLERQLKVLTAVQARTHFSLKQELKLIKNLIRDYTDEDYTYDPEYGGRKSKKSDYDLVDIIPVSDPNAATMSQRVVQYQAVIQMAQMAPQIYDLPQLHRSMLDVLGIKNAEKLVPLPDDQKPTDPVSENQAALKGKPLKAFQYQNHEAHIHMHQGLLQDPMVAASIGQNPQAQQIQSALQAHIAEHVGYMYRQQVEQQLGMAMPKEDEKLDPKIEYAMSDMMAKAAQQVLQQHQAAAAQQQAQQQAQDPLIQLQQQELQIRQQEVAIKQQKMQQDMQLAQSKLQTDSTLEAARLALEKEKLSGNLQLGAMKVSADMQYKKENIKSQEMRAGTQIGVDIAKTKSQQDLTARQAALDHGREMEDKRIDASKTALEHGRNSADRLHTIHKEELDRKQENFRMEQQARQAKQAAQKPKEKLKE